MIHLNILDYSFLIIVLLSLLFGLRRGFLTEIIAFLSWVAAFLVGIFFTKTLLHSVSRFIKTDTLSVLISFLILFLITLIVGAILNGLITRLSGKSSPSFADRFLGAIFGAARGVMILLLLVFIMSNTQLQNRHWYKNSHFTYQLQGMNAWVQSKVVKTDWKKSKNAILNQE